MREVCELRITKKCFLTLQFPLKSYHLTCIENYTLFANMSTGLSDETIGMFDVIGSFFVDKYYNDLFQRAKRKHADGAAKSLTDAYTGNLIAFCRGCEQNKQYTQMYKDLIKYYSAATSGFEMTFADFENQVLPEFVPPEYYRDFNTRDKEKLMREILIGGAREITAVCSENIMLRRIIDDHMNAANVEMLQRKMIDAFSMARGGYYSKFVSEVAKSSAQMVPKETFDKLKQEFTVLMSRVVDAETECAKAKSLLAVLVARLEGPAPVIDGGDDEDDGCYTEVSNVPVRTATPTRVAVTPSRVAVTPSTPTRVVAAASLRTLVANKVSKTAASVTHSSSAPPAIMATW